MEFHYFDYKYDTKGRFCSYWHQIQEVISHRHSTILEIGIGNKFVCDYLKKRNCNIISLDIDRRLNPDIVGSVLSIPVRNDSFEVVTCYEVLEHLPCEDFTKAISEIFRVSKSYAIISLPDVVRCYRLYVTIPKIGPIRKLIEVPKRKRPVHQFDGEH